MGNKTKVSCENCLNLTVSWNKNNVRILECGKLLGAGKIKLSKKVRKKVRRALLKFIRNGFIRSCPCFSLWKRKEDGYIKESIGQKAKDFIRGRVE